MTQEIVDLNERYSESWARDLATATAAMLGRDYCVVKDHFPDAGCMAYSRAYVENQLYKGEIGHGQVIAAYSPDGREIPREEVSEFH